MSDAARKAKVDERAKLVLRLLLSMACDDPDEKVQEQFRRDRDTAACMIAGVFCGAYDGRVVRPKSDGDFEWTEKDMRTTFGILLDAQRGLDTAESWIPTPEHRRAINGAIKALGLLVSDSIELIDGKS